MKNSKIHKSHKAACVRTNKMNLQSNQMYGLILLHHFETENQIFFSITTVEKGRL